MSVSDGAGYEILTPLPVTRNWLLKNDVEFARDVVGHNRQCEKDPLCQK
jgi:hypothetical protein